MQDARLEEAMQGAGRHGNAMEAAGSHLNNWGASTTGTGHRPVQSFTCRCEEARRPGQQAASYDARLEAARQDEAARARWSAASVYVQCLGAGGWRSGRLQPGTMHGMVQPGKMQQAGCSQA